MLNFSCGTPSREHEIARPPLVAAHGSPILGCPIVSTQDDIFTWHPLKLSDRQTLLTSLVAYAWQFGSCLSGEQTKTCFLLSVTIHLDSVFCVFYSDRCVLNFSQVLSSLSSILYLIFCILYSVFYILYSKFCILNSVFCVFYFDCDICRISPATANHSLNNCGHSPLSPITSYQTSFGEHVFVFPRKRISLMQSLLRSSERYLN